MSQLLDEPPAFARCGGRRLPVEPLRRAVDARGGLGALVRPGERPRLERAYDRAVAAGKVTHSAADVLAVRLLGLHPCLVWGEKWWDAPEAA